MAKNAKEVAVKGRQTKLSKKTNEELIDIILRKDATERKLNNQIVNFKSEINNLTNTVESLGARVKGFDADMSCTYEAYEKKLLEKTDRLKTISEQLSNEKMKVSEISVKNYNSLKTITLLEEKVKSYKKLAYVVGGFAIICLLGWICC